MPGFDFSNSTLRRWENPLSKYWDTFIENAVWDQGRLTITTYSVIPPPSTALADLLRPRRAHRFRISCEPLFVTFLREESFALILWQRAHSTIPHTAPHLIVSDSHWISSFKQNEPYGYSCQLGEAVHYVLCTSNAFAHIVSKQEPQFESLGFFDVPPPDPSLGPISITPPRVGD